MFRGLRFLWQFSWAADKLYLIIRIAQQFVNALAPLATVILPKYIIDELMGAARIDRLALLVSGYLLIVMIGRMLTGYLMMVGMNRRCKVSDAYSIFIHRKLARADYDQIQNPQFLDIKAKADKFLTADWHGHFYLLDEALSMIGNGITLSGVIAIVLMLNPLIGLLLVLLIGVQSYIDARAKAKEIELSLESAPFMRHFMYHERLFAEADFAKEIRVNGLADWLLGREAAFQQIENSFMKRRSDFYIGCGIKEALIGFLQQAVGYVYIVWQILRGDIGIGDFYLYTSAISTFSQSMRALIQSFVWIASYGKYYDALDEYLHIPETLRSGAKLMLSPPYTFRFEDVGYQYAGQAHFALRHVNIEIAAGEKLSVVGENGAGKTTFVKLLLRLYDPTEGRITINGIDIRTFDYDQYVAAFSAVFQDFQLFAFTLLENVALTDGGDRDRVIDALSRAGFSARLATLPDGIDTMVSRQFDMPAEFSSVLQQKQHQGFEPSGGEAQKIALARALYKNAPIAVLDEPTAALDPRAEYEMMGQFNSMVSGKMAIYVSHRMSASRFCDRVAVFSHGELIELGTHEALMQAQGQYQKLYTMQAQYYT